MNNPTFTIINPERSHNRYAAPNQITKIDNPADGSKICLLRIGKFDHNMIDEQFIEQILELSWHVTVSGYTSHTVTQKSEEKYNFGKKTVYLHEFVIKYCAKIDNPDDYATIDHINRCKFDNRIENLRYADQSMQNFNINRVREGNTHEDLMKLGITTYPTYISFSDYDKRFVIEKHPLLAKINKRQINGTRSGTIVQKYYDVLNKALALQEDADARDNTSAATRIKANIITPEQYNKLLPEYHLVNTCLGANYFRLDYKTDYNDMYEKHKHIIECSMNIVTKYTNTKEDDDKDKTKDKTKDKIKDKIKEKQTLIYNADVLHEDGDFILKKNMIPKYVSFIKESKTRGCKFTYDKRESDGTRTRKELSTGSKTVTLKNKYEDMQKALESMTIKNENENENGITNN